MKTCNHASHIKKNSLCLCTYLWTARSISLAPVAAYTPLTHNYCTHLIRLAGQCNSRNCLAIKETLFNSCPKNIYKI